MTHADNQYLYVHVADGLNGSGKKSLFINDYDDSSPVISCRSLIRIFCDGQSAGIAYIHCIYSCLEMLSVASVLVLTVSSLQHAGSCSHCARRVESSNSRPVEQGAEKRLFINNQLFHVKF